MFHQHDENHLKCQKPLRKLWGEFSIWPKSFLKSMDDIFYLSLPLGGDQDALASLFGELSCHPSIHPSNHVQGCRRCWNLSRWWERQNTPFTSLPVHPYSLWDTQWGFVCPSYACDHHLILTAPPHLSISTSSLDSSIVSDLIWRWTLLQWQ